jgi:hypothetical protein
MSTSHKWDSICKAIDLEEQQEAEKLERERADKYRLEQESKRLAYVEKYGCEPPQSTCCGMAAHHESHHQCHEKKEEESIGEKNARKKLAALAAKEDGNRVFKEGKYDLALQIYERVSWECKFGLIY